MKFPAQLQLYNNQPQGATMSKQRTTILATLTFLSSVLCPPVYAAPGEYWEVTTKMEMPGMPFAMPATGRTEGCRIPPHTDGRCPDEVPVRQRDGIHIS